MPVAAFDHAAIPIADVETMLGFYAALGFDVQEVRPPHFYCASFGASKINFHGPAAWQSAGFTLRGPTAQPGCGDFCFVWQGTAADLAAMLEAAGALVIEGPVPREGDRGETGISTYVRDPDGNLLEFIRYPD